MKKFNKKAAQGTWVTYTEDEDVELKIRPFSLFSLSKLPTATNIEMSDFWNIYDYVLMDWKGIEDEDGPLEFNEENKKMVYDYDQEISAFVVSQASEMREKIVSEKEVKNSKTSQRGATKKQEK